MNSRAACWICIETAPVGRMTSSLRPRSRRASDTVLTEYQFGLADVRIGSSAWRSDGMNQRPASSVSPGASRNCGETLNHMSTMGLSSSGKPTPMPGQKLARASSQVVGPARCSAALLRRLQRRQPRSCVGRTLEVGRQGQRLFQGDAGATSILGLQVRKAGVVVIDGTVGRAFSCALE